VAKILGPSLDDPIDIFLATHHGSKEGSVEELLDVTRPLGVLTARAIVAYRLPDSRLAVRRSRRLSRSRISKASRVVVAQAAVDRASLA